jgi:hypothetical protein
MNMFLTGAAAIALVLLVDWLGRRPDDSTAEERLRELNQRAIQGRVPR